MIPTPTTIIHRWSTHRLELTCCHPDPSVPATWELERICRHEHDHDTRAFIDGDMVRTMDDALTAGLSAAWRMMEGE